MRLAAKSQLVTQTEDIERYEVAKRHAKRVEFRQGSIDRHIAITNTLCKHISCQQKRNLVNNEIWEDITVR